MNSTLLRILAPCVVLLPHSVSAQFPTANEVVGRDPAKAIVAAIPANNPWVGANITYRRGPSGSIGGDLVGSGQITFPRVFEWGRARIPVLGNFTKLTTDGYDKVPEKVQALVSSTDGLRVGGYPYLVIKEPAWGKITIHGVAAYKLNSATDTSAEKTRYLQQIQLSPGIEFQILPNEKYATSVSVAPVFGLLTNSSNYRRIFGEERQWLQSTELTATVKLRPGYGLIAEYVIPMGSTRHDSKPALRAGVLVLGRKE